MKLKLFLIVTALLASYPANVFADDFDDEFVEFVDEIFNVEFADFGAFEEEAQLLGDTVAWDGFTLAEVIPEDGVYRIYNGAQLAWIAEQVNTIGSSGMTDCVISIEADIDLAGYNWTPIGYSYDTPFAGTVNGNGHFITGLNFDCSSYTHGGLFGCVIGTISNLHVETIPEGIVTSRCLTPSSSDPTKNGIGILAGSLDARNFDYNTKDYVGAIEGCSVDGSLTINNSYGETFYIGGIVGMNSGGELIRARSCADIFANSTDTIGTDEAFVGGIAGFNAGKLVNESELFTDVMCTLSAASANPSVGGIAGGNSGSVSGAYASCGFEISKHSTSYDDDYANIGNIVGTNSGTVENIQCRSDINLDIAVCNNTAQINVGSIVGLNKGEISDDGEIVSRAIISDCDSLQSAISVTAPAQKNIGCIVGLNANAATAVTDCKAYGSITVPKSLHRINAGGIAGVTYGIIDSCTVSIPKITATTLANSSIGSIAGISYNTITDCIAQGSIQNITADSPMALIYSGGISGEAYGRICRCYSDGTLSVHAPLSYLGGIAGRAELNDEKSIISGNGEGLISKCITEIDTKYANIAGGIVGDAYNILIQRSYSNSTIVDAVGAGGIAGRAGSTDIENCMVAGALGAVSSAGVVYEFLNSDNSISMSYIEPSLLGEANHPVSIADTAKYQTQRSYINTDVPGIEAVDDITSVTHDTAVLRSTFGDLNFDSIWSMGDTGPVLQYTVNSNALNSIGEITETKMHFNVALENPGVGQRVYVALYDVDNRFCGTVSAVCTEDNINSTGFRADLPLEYSYSYWDLEEWWNNGTWVPSKGLPFSYKAFTWDEENGMKSLSSVEEGILTYYFE